MENTFEGVEMSDQIGIVVIGCGYWGMNYVRTFTDLPKSRVVAVCDTCDDRLKEVRQRFAVPTLTNDIDQALNLPGVDAVVVCTPASSHYTVARRCLDAGKHVLIEKPLTTSSAHAQMLIALAHARSMTFMVGHTFLYNAGIRKVKACIEQHELGELYYFYSRRTNLGPIRFDVNALWDLAPHDVSIFNYLYGALPEWVSAVGTQVLHNCREDVGFIVLGYPGNVLGHIHVSWTEPNKAREVVVVGSDKRIVFNDLDPLERVRIFEKGIASTHDTPEPSSFGEHQFSIRDGDIISPKIEVTEPLKTECSHFIDCVLNGTTPLSDGYDGLKVVRVMEAISCSVAGHGIPISLQSGRAFEEQAPVTLEIEHGVHDHASAFR
jgi:predicted dehydrogenase